MALDFKTTLAGVITLGLMVASVFVKDPATKTVLMQLATATGGAGLLVAKDSGLAPVSTTVTKVVPTPGSQGGQTIVTTSSSSNEPAAVPSSTTVSVPMPDTVNQRPSPGAVSITEQRVMVTLDELRDVLAARRKAQTMGDVTTEHLYPVDTTKREE